MEFITLAPTFLLSFKTNENQFTPVGIFDCKDAIYEAVKVRFDCINEPLPIENEDYIISEFQANIIND